ncbi:hypothetical protein [Nocardia farcinica]|uniref:hypothetical protein n=1 Tax=Nocardia farcinica TaxID=37329 RepID=UPI001894A2AA|nr:hypothetical protein [Nocardia farcinica]MBF6271273.1 hypothetical protein [Nocardia farcinica]
MSGMTGAAVVVLLLVQAACVVQSLRSGSDPAESLPYDFGAALAVGGVVLLAGFSGAIDEPGMRWGLGAAAAVTMATIAMKLVRLRRQQPRAVTVTKSGEGRG